MPTYSFKCVKCGNQFEELVLKAGETSPCPKCGSGDVERGVSAPAARTGDSLRAKMGRGSSCQTPPGTRFG